MVVELSPLNDKSMNIIIPTIQDLIKYSSDIAGFIPDYQKRFGLMTIAMPELFKVLSSAILGDRGYVLLAIKDDKAVGFFVGSIYPELFTGEMIGCQNAIYLRKRCGSSWDMIKQFEKHCMTVGCKRVYTHIKDSSKFDKWQRAFSRLGYKPTELRFSKEF